MDVLLEELEARENEIGEYLRLLEFIEGGTEITRDDGQIFAVDVLLIKTLKGVIFMLLYNLIESTMREAISTIHSSISADHCGYENIRTELQKEVWRRAKTNNIPLEDLISDTSYDISKNLHTATYKPEKLFSGNVARDEIRRLASVYGFSESTNFSTTGHGRNLTEIKDNRNDLAHGNKTFAEIGSTNSLTDVQKHTEKVIEYLYAIVDNIIDCVDNKLYQ